MTARPRRSAVQPGERAPEFTLPMASGDGSVSLAQYRGKSPVYLALFRGLYCTFCRRQIAMFGPIARKLQAIGVETVGIVATDPDRARLYFSFRKPGMPMAADPDLTTHQAYGLPNLAFSREVFGVVGTAAARGLRQLNVEPPGDAHGALARLDGYELNDLDQVDLKRHQMQLTGRFLIDPDAIVRYTYVECARTGLDGFGETPSEEEILAQARAL